MKRHPKTVYAQSSDIKSRTYLEYRRDMKRKAIAELEVIDWLQQVFQQRYPDQDVKVSKYGGDRFLWFLRGGGITRKPDFLVEVNGEQQKVEFQYAEAENLSFYDFKISKVATTKRGEKGRQERVPKRDVLFLYVDKPTASYALLNAGWIVKNGQIAEIPAWRTQGYRVPVNTFREQLSHDPNLQPILASIENKNTILEFQYSLIHIVRKQLAQRIAQAIENEQIFSVIPNDLESFFHACFIMDAIQQTPERLNSWLEQAIKFAESVESLSQAFEATYCLDFLYFRVPPEEPLPNLKRFAEAISSLKERTERWYSPAEGAFRSSERMEPCLETRYALFVINAFEDLVQDMLHYRAKELETDEVLLTPIRKIYQNLPDPNKIAEFIRQCSSQ